MILAGPEATTFQDTEPGKLDLLSPNGIRALKANEDIERILLESDDPLPVMSVSVNSVRTPALPHVWIGLAMTEPGKGLQYVEDTEYYPLPDAPSAQVKVPGFALPVAYDSVSSVNFWPYPMDDKDGGSSNGWWDHWQRHRHTLRSGSFLHARNYEDDISFGYFATWLRQSKLEKMIREEPRVTTPIIVSEEPDASEVQLIPTKEHGYFFDDRHKAAIFLGKNAVQAMLTDTSRMGIPKELATEPFHEMMARVASELGLTYQA